MKILRKAKIAATRKEINLERRARCKVADAVFAAKLVRATPVTPEILASAEKRADRARAARKAKFLDQYRASSSVAA